MFYLHRSEEQACIGIQTTTEHLKVSRVWDWTQNVRETKSGMAHYNGLANVKLKITYLKEIKGS